MNSVTFPCNDVILVSREIFIFVIKLSLPKSQNQTTKIDTILVIEDNEDILENLTEFLELEGYKIPGTNNGKRGIELAKEFMPDLIV